MIHMNAHQNAEQTTARLVKEADFIIAITYTMNETVAILNALGAGAVLDAIALANPDAMEWYDKAIKTLHMANMQAPELQFINEAYTEEWERVRPARKPPANAAQLAEEFKEDDENGNEEADRAIG
jgi:ornithine cyclodeaminase/alanine dehydrogenase-like protein (mu-crystallin family)